VYSALTAALPKTEGLLTGMDPALVPGTRTRFPLIEGKLTGVSVALAEEVPEPVVAKMTATMPAATTTAVAIDAMVSRRRSRLRAASVSASRGSGVYAPSSGRAGPSSMVIVPPELNMRDFGPLSQSSYTSPAACCQVPAAAGSADAGGALVHQDPGAREGEAAAGRAS